jgi:hypothetical protein
MRTPLLIESPDAGMVATAPCHLHVRALARLQSWSLDASLARGISPDTSAPLSMRAHRLIGLASRRKLARQIRDVIGLARRPHHRLDAGIHVCTEQVMLCRETIEALADRLEALDPVDCMGVAQARVLLHDGAGPLYHGARAQRLEASLQAALDALEPR